MSISKIIIFIIIILLLSFLQVVQEYERAVIFRLGRLVRGGAKEKSYIKILNKF